MLTLLYLIINASLMVVPVPYVPYTYSLYLDGCVNLTAYLDPLSGYGISGVYVINPQGALTRATLSRESTPTFVAGRICGGFLAVSLDRWRRMGPLIPVSMGQPSVYNLLGSYQANFTDSAIIEIKSLYKPNITGLFIYKISEQNIMGVYFSKYIAYQAPITIEGYGLVNITPISLSSRALDYYVYVPSPGVSVSGGFPINITGLRFAPSQIYLLGRPSVVISQVKIPVTGACNGSAYAPDPLARPLTVVVAFNDGEEYTIQMPYFPRQINSTLLLGVNATTLDGIPLNDLNITAYPVTYNGQLAGRCLVEGIQYYVAVLLNGSTMYFPAVLKDGVLTASTNIVKPSVVVKGVGYGVVRPAVAPEGSNVTITIYLNGTQLAEYAARARPVIIIDDSDLTASVRVRDILGSPLPDFYVVVGNLTFRGRDGLVHTVPISQLIVVGYEGRQYLAPLSSTVTVPVLTRESLIKILAGSLIAGAAAGLALAPKGGAKERKGDKDEHGDVIM